MRYKPARPAALVVGGGYYVLDRLADPTELVTLVRHARAGPVVRSTRGLEYPVSACRLSPVPPDVFYRQLRCSCTSPCSIGSDAVAAAIDSAESR